MTVAQRKKQEHIVDHVLYCLQMEDLIRAAQFQPQLLQQWAEQQAQAERESRLAMLQRMMGKG